MHADNADQTIALWVMQVPCIDKEEECLHISGFATMIFILFKKWWTTLLIRLVTVQVYLGTLVT